MIIGNLNWRNVLNKAISMENNEKPFFDFKQTFTYDPFAMLFIHSVIKNNLKKYNNCRFTLSYDPYSKNVSYAGHMGFFKSISENASIGKMPGEASGGKNYVPVTKLDFSSDLKKGIDIEESIEKNHFRLQKY